VTGRLDFDHTPYIALELPGAGVHQEFVVDTGFNGPLYLPEDKIAGWDLPFITSAPMTLANHSIIVADVFEATVIWFSAVHRVSVVAGPSGCDSLLGMELLKGCRIELDDAARVLRIDRL